MSGNIVNALHYICGTRHRGFPIALELMLPAARGLHRLHRCGLGLALAFKRGVCGFVQIEGAWQQNGLAGFQAVYAGICNLTQAPKGNIASFADFFQAVLELAILTGFPARVISRPRFEMQKKIARFHGHGGAHKYRLPCPCM